MANSASRPARRTSSVNTDSAIVERQMFPWQINSTRCICGFLSIAIIELEYRIYACALARLRSQRANLIVTSVSAQATSENTAPTAPT